ncbi:MAG TPA: alkyl hydroperoxide reductase subunit F, partial [Microthrixaceae bacterium]|nr:alkyl hydroperoxide reductase subunit F [Microthrixaceae bacterium]
MLDDAIATQLRTHLQKVVQPIVLRASLDDGAKSAELAALLDEIAAMSELITVERTDDDERRPSFAIVRAGTDVSVRFAGIPLGH